MDKKIKTYQNNIWKTDALNKQLNFKKEVLKLSDSGFWKGESYLQILSDKDAQAGQNFYCYNNSEEWENLQSWADKSKGKEVNFKGTGMKNMLRSEHIPYNFFYPLEKLRQRNPQALKLFLETLFRKQNIHVDEVLRIKIEFASDRQKKELLDDNTSFDVYIEYLDGNEKCGLGIEVKYTELSYPYGKTEKQRMFDESSFYNQLTRNAKIYQKNAWIKLRQTKLKQHWRNHLLGLRLVEIGVLNKFYSIHVYPKGNIYQGDACIKYSEWLVNDHKDSFIPITFEKFIEVAEKTFSDQGYQIWAGYLKTRYLS